MDKPFSLNPAYRYSAFGIGLAVVGFCGWQMLSLPFFGHYPLGFMLGAYMVVLALFLPRIVKSSKDLLHLGLATLSGLGLWLGFPVMPFTFLLFVAFVPLLLIEDDLQSRYSKRTMMRLAFYSFHAFFLWNILSTYWVANSAFMAGVFANVVNALLMMVVPLGYHWLRHRAGEQFRWPAFVVFWLMFEFNHLHWELTWPFLGLGNGLSHYPSWVQWYEYTGALGGTLWVLLGNVFFYKPVKSLLSRQMPGLGLWIRPLIWVVIPLVISGIIYVTYEPEGRAIEVGVIQPNYEPHYEKFEVSRREQQERFISLARSILTPETRILVFPETIFGGFDINDVEVQPEIRAFRALLDSFPNCAIIMGLDPYRFLEPGEDSPAKRTYTRSAPDTLYWEAYNLALMLRPNEPTETYLKGKLVPGAEIFPYRHLLFFMEPLVNQLDGSLEGLRRSIERKVFRHEGAAVGPVICYESVFGDYCTGYVRKGANVLAIITNDGWWDETPGHLQHLKLGALRAIETRRDIIRSANTGISCFIDQRGDINQATAYEETKAFTGAVRLNEKITFYTKWGDFIGRISFFMAILIISYGIVVPWRRKWHL